VIDIPTTWVSAREDVLPVIRRATEPSASLVNTLIHPQRAIVRRQIAPLLSELLVLDRPHTRTFIHHTHLDTWKVSQDVAFASAYDALDPSHGLVVRDDGIVEFRPDGYAASRVRIPGWLNAFASQFDGQALIAMPSNEVVFVGGIGHAKTLIHLCATAFANAGTRISPLLYTGHGTRLRPWHAPNLKTETYLRLVARKFLAREYKAQRDALDGATSLPLAELTLGQHTTKTHCTWQRGRPMLLPAADMVHLVDGSQRRVVAMPDLLGRHLTPLPWQPPRFQTVSWPKDVP
jgi:hypothetical protein